MSAGLPVDVRRNRPLVYAITNFVTMDWVARGLLAAGARPLMAREPDEAGPAAESADAVVLNLGTWSPAVQAAMLAAGRAANQKGVPVVLDPVGAGGLSTRTRAALELLSTIRVTAIRGNAGEIAALAGQSGHVQGVDARSGVSEGDVLAAARQVAARYGCLVAATGVADVVTDGHKVLRVRGGHGLMAQIPGTGCLATALVAAALAAGPDKNPQEQAGSDLPGDPLARVAQSLLWVGVAGEQAALTAAGPGSFAAAYLDALSGLEALPGGRISPPLADRLALYVIVSGTTPVESARAILAAGAGTLQFREKSLSMAEQINHASRLYDLCQEFGALFLVNDRTDLALAVGADGVHLGQDDLPVATARKLLGPEAIIGATCETPAEAQAATAAGADYIGTGPVYATPSKADAGTPYGPAIVRRISEATALPVVGIGGIGLGGAAPVIRAGGSGVAVISSVVGASDPGLAAHQLLAEIHGAKGDDLS